MRPIMVKHKGLKIFVLKVLYSLARIRVEVNSTAPVGLCSESQHSGSADQTHKHHG